MRLLLKGLDLGLMSSKVFGCFQPRLGKHYSCIVPNLVSVKVKEKLTTSLKLLNNYEKYSIYYPEFLILMVMRQSGFPNIHSFSSKVYSKTQDWVSDSSTAIYAYCPVFFIYQVNLLGRPPQVAGGEHRGGITKICLYGWITAASTHTPQTVLLVAGLSLWAHISCFITQFTAHFSAGEKCQASGYEHRHHLGGICLLYSPLLPDSIPSSWWSINEHLLTCLEEQNILWKLAVYCRQLKYDKVLYENDGLKSFLFAAWSLHSITAYALNYPMMGF